MNLPSNIKNAFNFKHFSFRIKLLNCVKIRHFCLFFFPRVLETGSGNLPPFYLQNKRRHKRVKIDKLLQTKCMTNAISGWNPTLSTQQSRKDEQQNNIPTLLCSAQGCVLPISSPLGVGEAPNRLLKIQGGLIPASPRAANGRRPLVAPASVASVGAALCLKIHFFFGEILGLLY